MNKKKSQPVGTPWWKWKEEKNREKTYITTNTCLCGAKLVYVKENGSWNCSTLLLNIPVSQEAVQHAAKLPFSFYVK